MDKKNTRRTKGQHTVPRCYMARFSANGRTIWAFDKFDRKIFNPSIRDVPKESYFYDYPAGTQDAQDPTKPFDRQQVEKLLSKIEGRFTAILDGLIPRLEAKGITSAEIIELAPYIAIQWMRTKEYREALLAIAQQSGQAMVDAVAQKNLPEFPKDQYPRFVLDPVAAAALHNDHFFNQ